MAQNNQLNQNTDTLFTKEDAYKTLTMVNTWITNIDTKISFALTLTGVLIGFIFNKGIPSAWKRVSEVLKLTELSGGEIIAVILVCLDLEEQIHTNSMICSKKAKCYNMGIKFLLANIILSFICMAFRLI